MTATVDDQQSASSAPAGDSPRTEPTPVAEPPAAPGRDGAPAPSGAPQPRRTWTDTVARQAATVSSKLTPIARRAGDRVASASPTTLLLGLLGLLTTLSVVASLAFHNALGVTSAVLFVPALSAAIGALAVRCLDERRARQAQREQALPEAMQLRQLEHTLEYVDTKLSAGLSQFGSDRHNDAVIAMFQAKAATELYLGSEPRPAADSAS
ncbi:hypothetical protein JDV09_23675, partial [Mycobacterium sp. Y57]|uniref:hypothetical protein n=1 Tax=Mycolicibacterium xanthum TaxID=2796469 RepID=UPI001C864141